MTTTPSQQAEPTEALLAAFSYDPLTGLFRSKRTEKLVGHTDVRDYVTIHFAGKKYRAHRLAWLFHYGKWPDEHIDHINHVRSDNRIANLRDLTLAQNCENCSRGPRRSPHGPGIYLRYGSYQALLSVKNKRIVLGTYPIKEAAQAAYFDAKRIAHPHYVAPMGEIQP